MAARALPYFFMYIAGEALPAHYAHLHRIIFAGVPLLALAGRGTVIRAARALSSR